MHLSVLKKLTSLALILLSCLSVMPCVSAFIYSPGPTEYELDRNYLIESNGKVTLEEENIVFEEGGIIKFDLLLPFDADKLTLAFTKSWFISIPTVTITTDQHNYIVSPKAGEKTATVDITELIGSNTISIESSKDLTISSVKFSKVNENYNEVNAGEIPSLTAYDEAVLTSVIFKNDAAVVKTRGAMQRLDIDNIRLTPMNIDGRLYVPFKKYAESLGYYAEDYPDKAYIYMTGETSSLSLIGGNGYLETDKEGKREVSFEVIYKDGKAWVPVRSVAEALGFTVCYKDGYVVIDDRLRAKKVVENEEIFIALTEDFASYIPAKKTIGKTYHVAQTAVANDENTGTENAPFLTIQEAVNRAVAGDTVIVHAGTYREEVKLNKDGTVFAPITIKAAEGEDVVISALEKLSGFTKYIGNLYRATVTEDLGFGRNQLFYKGEALTPGRHPNSDTKPGVVPYPAGVPEGVYATKGNIHITDEDTYGKTQAIAYSDTDLDQPVGHWVGGTYVSLKGQGWSLASGEIIASQPGQITVKDHPNVKSYNLGLSNKHYYRYSYDSDYAYITNHINTVDKAGEWYMNSTNDVMYLYPPEGANLAEDFEVKQRQVCIDLSDRKYITIKGIDTIGGGIKMSGDNTEGCVLDGGEFKYIAHHTVLLDQERYAMTDAETSTSLKSIKAGEAGICVGGKNNAIVNSKIDYSSATGITLVGKYHYINNNIVSNTSYSGGYPGAIWVAIDVSKGNEAANLLTGGHFITYNTLFNSGRSVTWMASRVNENFAVAVSPVEIAYNRIYNGSLTARDTSVTYEYGFMGGNDKSKTRMHHNFVYNPGYKDEETGNMLSLIYHDGYTAAMETYCNVTYYDDLDYEPAKQIFVQDAKYTVIRNRNNAELGYLANGESDIVTSDYPGARPFEPGADHDSYARSLDNYNALKSGYRSYYPSSVSGDQKTYTFENVKIDGDKRTEIALYMNRRTGESEKIAITTKVYDKNNTLVQTATNYNKAETNRFYVYNLHKGLSVLKPMAEGTYKLEVTFSDDTLNLNKIALESFDTKYDNLYTEEMEKAGIVAYTPASQTEATPFTYSEDFSDVTFADGASTTDYADVGAKTGLTFKVSAADPDGYTFKITEDKKLGINLSPDNKNAEGTAPIANAAVITKDLTTPIKTGVIVAETAIKQLGDANHGAWNMHYLKFSSGANTGKTDFRGTWNVKFTKQDGSIYQHTAGPGYGSDTAIKLQTVYTRLTEDDNWVEEKYLINATGAKTRIDDATREYPGDEVVSFTFLETWATGLDFSGSIDELLFDYTPASKFEDTETVTFENVPFESGKKTLLNLHLTREIGQGSFVNITAEVYDGSTLLKTATLANSIENSASNTYEALKGIVVIPELETSGNYKVVIKLSDRHSEVIRLITEEAEPVYDNLFNENVFLGGSFDEAVYNKSQTDWHVTAIPNVTPSSIEKYTYYAANNCRDHIVTYKDRVIAEDAEYLRVTYGTDSTSGGATVKLYVDGYNKHFPFLNTPIATWTTDDTSWRAKAEYVELANTLKAGTHTFYFVFEGTGKCTDFYNFSFGNEAWNGESLDKLN